MLNRQEKIHKFMKEVYDFFKNHKRNEIEDPIVIPDLVRIYEHCVGCCYRDNIHEWIDENGETPIHYAVRFKENESLLYLIGEKSDNGNRFNILQRNKQGKTAMRLAFENGNISAIDAISSYYKKWFRKKICNLIKSLAYRTTVKLTNDSIAHNKKERLLIIKNPSASDVRNIYNVYVKAFSDKEIEAIMNFYPEDAELDYNVFQEWKTAKNASKACKAHFSPEEFEEIEEMIERSLGGEELKDKNDNYTDKAEKMFMEELEKECEVIDLLPHSILYKN